MYEKLLSNVQRQALKNMVNVDNEEIIVLRICIYPNHDFNGIRGFVVPVGAQPKPLTNFCCILELL
jgi:hypothetical protein